MFKNTKALKEIMVTLKNTFKNDNELFTSLIKYSDLVSKVELNEYYLHDAFFIRESRGYERNEMLLNGIRKETGLRLSEELIKVLCKINNTTGLSKDIQIYRDSTFAEIFVVLNTFYNVDLYKMNFADIIYLIEFSEYATSLSEKAV